MQLCKIILQRLRRRGACAGYTQ